MRRISIEIVLVILVLLVHVYAIVVPANSLMIAWFHSDDAFYYFKTAQNFAEGYGFTFDRIDRSSGFHPLWMAICVPVFALARFDLVLPLRLIVAISAILSAGTTLLVYRLARRHFAAGSAAVAASFWAFSPFIHGSIVKLGLESGLSAFFIVLLLFRVALADDVDKQKQPDAKQIALTGFIAALAVLARLDNVFLVFILGAWLVLRPVRLRYLVVTDILLIGFSVIWSYFMRVGFQPGFEIFSRSNYIMIALSLLIRLPLYYLSGLYNRPHQSLSAVFSQLAIAALVSIVSSALLGGLMLGLLELGAFPGFPRMVLPYEAGFMLVAVLAIRLVATLLTWNASETEEKLLWIPTLTRAGLFFSPIGIILLVYMGASQWYFGTPSPVSGQIKRWWGTLPNPLYGQPVTSFAELLGFAGRNQPWGLASEIIRWPKTLPGVVRGFVYGIAASSLLLLRYRTTGRGIHRMALYPLLVAGWIQLLSYTGTGYIHTRPWYWAVQHLLITLLMGLVLDHILSWLGQKQQPKSSPVAWVLSRGIPVLLSAWLLVSFVAGEVKNMPMFIGAGTAQDYLGGVQALEAVTEPGARIGSTGGGVIAYFLKGRTMVNLDGLMNSVEYYHLLQQGRASDYLTRIGLEYIYSNEYGITSSDPYFQFKDHLRKIDDIAGSALFDWVP